MSLSPNTKIKVLHVFDKIGMKGSPIHGASRVLMSWWPEFDNTDFELFLCVLKARSEGSLSLEKVGINARYVSRGKFDPRIILDLVKYVKTNDIRILHCHGYGATNFGRIAGFICRVPVIIHEHMIDTKVPVYQKIADWILAGLTTKGLAVSESVKEFMINGRYSNSKKIQVIYNGIPSDYIRTYDEFEKQKIAKDKNIPVNKPLVGIVGRLNPIKRHTDFIEAAKIVLQQHPGACFLIIGEGDLHQELKHQAQQLNISDSVLFLGHCENVLELISLLDVLVLCSYSEGCPVSILEGMASAKAIVATEVGGIPELLSDNETGLLVPAYSSEALAQAIVKILSNEILKLELGANVLSVCKQKFLVSHTVDRIQNVYLDII